MGGLTTYESIIIFASAIIVSYLFNYYSKKSGIPAVLMLISLGVGMNFFVEYSTRFNSILKVLGTVGLILIVLEAALDLKLLKEKIGVIFKSLLVSVIGLGGTSYLAALFLTFIIPDFEFINALLISIPLSILSSAIILPSIDSLEGGKKEFMIYESTFSDIVGIVAFYAVLGMTHSTENTNEVYGLIFGNLLATILFSVLISYFLIYIFQKLKGHAKLFLLISVLLVLYALGKMLHLSSLIIILVFGLILNNYKLFFRGFLKDFILEDKIEGILEDFKVVTVESAFVVRTFFFILFGWSITLVDLMDLKAFLVSLGLLVVIYLVRILVLLIFNGASSINKVTPEVFLAPRGLITILLFYAIPPSISSQYEFNGILLFVIIFSCLIMTWSLISEKKKLEIQEEEDFEILEIEENSEEEI